MAKLLTVGEIREHIYTITNVFEFPEPKEGQNTHVVEGFRKIPVPLEKDTKGKVTKWGDPKIIPIKVFCTLPRGTTLDQIEYVTSEEIRFK